MAAEAQVGFFGKLPCNGDFLQRRVPQPFLDRWDPWLQECVHASRGALQESWLDTYLTSPLWRFVLGASVCGSGAYAGLLAPSVDRVGRYFPLTIVTQIDVDAGPLDFAVGQRPWFEALEALVLAALENPDAGLGWFDGEVAATAALLSDAGGEPERALEGRFDLGGFPAQGAAWRAPLGSAAGLQSAFNALAHRELSARLRPLALWWTEGSAAAAPSWLSLRGLPQPAQFAGMLGGRWTEFGWSDLGELDGAPVRKAALPATGGPQALDPAAEALPAREPRVTVPDVQLTDVETNRAAFVMRPDVGLWAVTAAVSADPAAARLVADALQQIAPAASLTGLVEAARGALLAVHGHLRRLASRDVQRIEAQANVAVLLAAGPECALLCAGGVQNLRLRAGSIDVIDAAQDGERGLLASDAGSLLDLVTAAPAPAAADGLGGAAFQDLHVHYERLQHDDHWILCARRLFDAADRQRLAATAASGMPISVPLIVDSLLQAAPGDVIPVMTVEI